jgi:hypothetical protein
MLSSKDSIKWERYNSMLAYQLTKYFSDNKKVLSSDNHLAKFNLMSKLKQSLQGSAFLNTSKIPSDMEGEVAVFRSLNISLFDSEGSYLSLLETWQSLKSQSQKTAEIESLLKSKEKQISRELLSYLTKNIPTALKKKSIWSFILSPFKQSIRLPRVEGSFSLGLATAIVFMMILFASSRSYSQVAQEPFFSDQTKEEAYRHLAVLPQQMADIFERNSVFAYQAEAEATFFQGYDHTSQDEQRINYIANEIKKWLDENNIFDSHELSKFGVLTFEQAVDSLSRHIRTNLSHDYNVATRLRNEAEDFNGASKYDLQEDRPNRVRIRVLGIPKGYYHLELYDRQRNGDRETTTEFFRAIHCEVDSNGNLVFKIYFRTRYAEREEDSNKGSSTTVQSATFTIIPTPSAEPQPLQPPQLKGPPV